jgi:acetyl-CoA C-acetyltransferase
MPLAYVYDAIRTPRSKGKAGVGSLYGVKPINLLSGLLQGLEKRHQLDTSQVDDVLMGCVTPIGEQGSNIAKSAVIHAGWHESVPGFQLDRFCASGLEAVNTAAAKVASGMENLIVAGGVESMSRVTMGSNGGPFLADPQYIANNLSVPQGIGADLIATIEGYSREQLDGYALESQQRATHARASGWFDGSVMAVTDTIGGTILQRDDFIKSKTSLEGLGALRAAFATLGGYGFDDMALRKYPHIENIHHVHTAGNSSGVVDGASAVLIGNKAIGKDLSLTPRARIIATAVVANDPVIMLTGPGPAAKKCLSKAGLSTNDIDLWEINEAFASVALRFMKDLDISRDITNVNGGAIAMGHPLGATGGCLVSIMLDELERRNKKRGLIALCVGGGMGIATIIERD